MPHEELLPIIIKRLTKEQLWPILEAITNEIGHNYGTCPLCGGEEIPVDEEGEEIEGEDVSNAHNWQEVHDDDCPVTLIEQSFSQGGTTTMSEELKAGWGKALVSRKWHYFVAGDSISLCRKVGFFFGEREDNEHDHKDNCAECKKKRATLQKVNEPGQGIS